MLGTETSDIITSVVFSFCRTGNGGNSSLTTRRNKCESMFVLHLEKQDKNKMSVTNISNNPSFKVKIQMFKVDTNSSLFKFSLLFMVVFCYALKI